MSVRLPDSMCVSALLPRETKPSFFQGENPHPAGILLPPTAQRETQREKETDERKVDIRTGHDTNNVQNIPPHYTPCPLKRFNDMI